MNLVKISWKTSEFWWLVVATVLIVGDSIAGSLTGNSVFTNYPEAREFLEKASLAWAGLRTILKMFMALLTKQPVVG